MIRTRAIGDRWYWTAAVMMVTFGCRGPASTSQPVAATAPPEQQFTQRSVPVPPEDVSLFGEHPDGEQVPYENRLLTNMKQHTFSAVGRDFDPDLFSDGKTMVFASTRNSKRPDIFLKHVDGYAITQITSDPSDDIQPRFSPDGMRVVFASNRAGNWDIWMVNLDGTDLMQLTRDRSDEVAPCFSPDGRQVAFTAWGRQSHQWETWVLSVDRPGVRRFLCYGMFPDWSPDGTQIAFQRARQRGTRWFSVWTVDLVDDEARHPTELAYSDTAACVAPRWSPDGKTIVYCAVRQNASPHDDPRDTASDVWLVEADTGVRMKVTDGAAGAFNPAWASTGRIYFVSGRTGVENIWSLNTEVGSYPVGRGADRSDGETQVMANTPVQPEGK